MNKEFMAAIKQLATAKNIEEELIIEAVKNALATAYKKDYWNKEQEIEVELNWDSIEASTVYVVKEVVEEVEDENYEISVKDAQKMKPDAEEWDEIKLDVTPTWYWRVAAQAAKQVIMQKINEAEKNSVYEKFKWREDTVLYWQISRVEWTYISVEIDWYMVPFWFKQRIKWEQYKAWQRLSFYLDKVEMAWRWPKIVISRSAKQLLIKLLEREIPEIADWEIEVKAYARDAWNRSKLAVISNDPNIDPVWTCVWFKWARINNIIDELWGERIDIIEFEENPAKLIAKTLQPAKITKVIIINDEDYVDEETQKFIKKRAAIFVDEEERAMAIWKKWQNITLATNLTWFELDMYNNEELEAFEQKLEELEQECVSYTLEENTEEEISE